MNVNISMISVFSGSSRMVAGAVIVVMVLLGSWSPAMANTVDEVKVVSNAEGMTLQVNGEDFMVFGMNWGYMPIGENYMYDFWNKPDEFIEAALARDMPLLKNMGVNAIRQYVGIPPRWVQYIYQRYGIYTVLNHPCARYGFTLDGAWIPSVDYSDERLREAVKTEVVDLVKQFKDTPGILMWLLGNENNYGLSWSSFEIEALPEGERNAAMARYLYSMFGEITDAIKTIDTERPVAIANGDVQYIDIIAEECNNIDVFGTNVYRGISARDLFQVVKTKLDKPVLFTEFGADAWNAKEMREDQVTQARYLIGQWEEIYEQSSGKGRVGNAIGGLIFQWSDGWWKFRQEERLDIHDTNASWPNAGYPEDYVEGENNMNEEWWGICAKGPTDYTGLYQLYPRAAYYALRDAFRLDPYAPDTDINKIKNHFDGIKPMATALEARGNKATLTVDALERVRVTNVRAEFETFSTGGAYITTPNDAEPQEELPAFKGFDHLESFYTDFRIQPAGNIFADLSLNILGHVPLNPIDQIFYENRGLTRTLVDDDGDLVRLEGIERVKVYQAAVSWDDRWLRLDAFYRTGHLHWQFEGDFFGIYHDAYYGENIDIYNGEAPVGVEIAGKKKLEGLKVAFGPQLWWGANPSIVAKYQRSIGRFDCTGIFQEDIGIQAQAATSSAIPVRFTRKATIQATTQWKRFQFEAGGIWSGYPDVGETFQIAEESGDSYNILQDEVKHSDTFGAKGKVTYQKGRWNWYAQAAYMGIVANAGPTSTYTFTGWNLRDSGSGNQTNFLTGLAVTVGDYQIGPNFLWQKPLVDPMPQDPPPPGRARNILEDPFAVRGNRETIGAELVLTYDPEPASWMWQWDNDVRETSKLAWSLGLALRHLPTTMDGALAINEEGNVFAFAAATPPRDLMWEANFRLVSKFATQGRLVGHVYGGTGDANGDDPRLIHRYGGDARVTWKSTALETFVKIRDWGPYDYHRDYNLTFPLQLMADLSHTLGTPRWFGYPQTRIGIRGTWRSLNEYSPRYCPAQELNAAGIPECITVGDYPKGDEWEIRTYIHISI